MVRYSAGIVTAYGAAKRAGYTGTYEDFCRQQAEYAENAAAVEQAKNTAVGAASTATAKAGEATTAATAAQTAKIQTEAAASQALTDISAERSGAISAVRTEGATQTANATAQAQAAATSATTANTKASEASASATSAGQSATNAAASATSAANSASAAQGVLDSIPEDYSDLSKDVDKLKADLVDLQEGGYIADAQQIQTKINAWLTQHPEATTTVQDGSLTYAKLVTGTLGFVTPEMYGAVGDGIADDTDAFNLACNSGFPVVLMENKIYYVPSKISVNNPLVLVGNQATIKTDRSTGNRLLFVLYGNAKRVTFNNVHFFTTLGQTVTGAHGETIQNRSNKTAIAGYWLDVLFVENCTFENFDECIIGITSKEDTTLQNVLDKLIVSKTTMINILQGISRHYRHVNIDGCTITLDPNAGTGEHCIYILNEVLEDFFVSNTLLDTKNSASCSAIQFYPRSDDSISQVRSICHIQNCIINADGYVTSKGDTSINLSNCTLRSPSYNATNRIRAFSVSNADTLVVSNSSVQIELYDRSTELITYKSCDIYTDNLLDNRMSLFEAFDCIFKNIGLTLSNNAKIVNCEFSKPVGRYYLLVPSAVTKSCAINCIFKAADAVGISYNSNGYCDVISPITTLPQGTNTPNINVVNKIEVSL